MGPIGQFCRTATGNPTLVPPVIPNSQSMSHGPHPVSGLSHRNVLHCRLHPDTKRLGHWKPHDPGGTEYHPGSQTRKSSPALLATYVGVENPATVSTMTKCESDPGNRPCLSSTMMWRNSDQQYVSRPLGTTRIVSAEKALGFRQPGDERPSFKPDPFEFRDHCTTNVLQSLSFGTHFNKLAVLDSCSLGNSEMVLVQTIRRQYSPVLDHQLRCQPSGRRAVWPLGSLRWPRAFLQLV